MKHIAYSFHPDNHGDGDTPMQIRQKTFEVIGNFLLFKKKTHFIWNTWDWVHRTNRFGKIKPKGTFKFKVPAPKSRILSVAHRRSGSNFCCGFYRNTSGERRCEGSVQHISG